MLYHYHSNSLEQLATSLIQHLDEPDADVLQARVILVQNPGMKRWLQQSISRATGIAANIEFPLPSRFIWDIFAAEFGDMDQLRNWDSEVLRWHLMQVLADQHHDPGLRMLDRYLARGNDDTARLQLASRLATLFDQYQIYRPDLIQGWQDAVPTTAAGADWQALLWHLLQKRIAGDNRNAMVQRLLDRLQTRDAGDLRLPSRLFVFGLSSLSPLHLGVLLALARRIDVYIFHQNPCRHYWGDIRSRRESLHQGEEPLPENELLASLGQQGREFIDLFYSGVDEYEECHLFRHIEPDSLLHRVQHDILNLANAQTALNDPLDRSIQLVSCYSELRELQVLHDRLLEMLSEDPTLQAHEIVVMCPDINELAPYIEAVFGEQVDNRALPFTISDHNQALSSPLMQAILSWILLPDSRLTANEVLGWLELPALQRAYGLNPDDIEHIRYWVRANHVHWGLNGEFRRAQQLGDDDRYSWQFGIKRLLAAYCMHEEAGELAGQVASPVLPGTSGLEIIGRLQRLLDDLGALTQRLAQRRSIAGWQIIINELFDTLLRPDEDEEWQLKVLRNELASWQQQAQQAGFDAAVDYRLLHYLMRETLTRGSAHHQYLSGGINFCNLIPMRCLPFRVVCLIGMGDGHFPRGEAPLQFDLIARHPRKGDRARRDDDRYMFLQSLLAAGDRFYVSYVGRNKQDDSELQPSVVVSELIDHVRATTGLQLPLERTPLQAFSPSNFIRGSYAAEWLPPADDGSTRPFASHIETPDSTSLVGLDELTAFFRDPAGYFMRARLGMKLYEFAASIEDDEVFNLQGLRRYQVNAALLEELVERGEVDTGRLARSGVVPDGEIGRLQLQHQLEQIERLYRSLVKDPDYHGRQLKDGIVELAHTDLSGQVESFSRDCLLQLQHSTVRGSHFLRYWIEHNFLCVLAQPAATRFYFLDNKNPRQARFAPRAPADAHRTLSRLMSLYQQGQQRILPFYPDSAYQYEQKKRATDASSALAQLHKLWAGDDFSYFPEAQNAYLRTGLKDGEKGSAPFNDEFFALSSQVMAPLLDNLEIA